MRDCRNLYLQQWWKTKKVKSKLVKTVKITLRLCKTAVQIVLINDMCTINVRKTAGWNYNRKYVWDLVPDRCVHRVKDYYTDIFKEW